MKCEKCGKLKSKHVSYSGFKERPENYITDLLGQGYKRYEDSKYIRQGGIL